MGDVKNLSWKFGHRVLKNLQLCSFCSSVLRDWRVRTLVSMEQERRGSGVMSALGRACPKLMPIRQAAMPEACRSDHDSSIS